MSGCARYAPIRTVMRSTKTSQGKQALVWRSAAFVGQRQQWQVGNRPSLMPAGLIRVPSIERGRILARQTTVRGAMDTRQGNDQHARVPFRRQLPWPGRRLALMPLTLRDRKIMSRMKYPEFPAASSAADVCAQSNAQPVHDASRL